jgi:hypothetical protein
MSPNMDARVDITDIYAFQKPGDPGKSILIMNVNPLAKAAAFDPDAVYELKVDTNGDAVAEIAFRITFSPLQRGTQTATVRRATGDEAAGLGTAGEPLFVHAPVSLSKSDPVRVTTTQKVIFDHQSRRVSEGEFKFFAGIRSDPFFFDLLAFLAGFKFHNPGSDFFIDKNVFSIALEVPNAALGPNPNIGVWFRVLIPTSQVVAEESGEPLGSGSLFQIDRMGRPAINTVFNHGEDKDDFNEIEPTKDRTTLTVDPNPKAGVTFLQSFTLTLQALGNPNAAAIANILLPDILTYDYASSAGYLNGRRLQDDVIDISLNLVTNGAITTDYVGPHTDYLSQFPYVGNPH